MDFAFCKTMTTQANFTVRLTVRTGSQAGQVISFRRLPFVIGSEPGCHLRVTSAAISPRHCVLQAGPGGIVIKDLGSTSGTWIDGVRIESSTSIGDGDELRIGALTLAIRVEALATAKG